jgi:hypothetical protein
MDLARTFRSVRRRLARTAEPFRRDPRQRVFFLHIGKTAGTQISAEGSGIAHQINAKSPRWRVVPCPHGRKLRSLPEDAAWFCSIRRPETRFRSAFYSRKRKGRPRNHIEWTPDEAIAFERFEHASDLAEALFAGGETGRQAFFAMKSIAHTSANQVDWFDRSGYFLERHPPVWIIRQEAFDADLRVLLDRLGHEAPVEVARDPLKAHANDYEGVPPLTDKALEALRTWYAQDHEFYRLCSDWMETNRQAPPLIAR